MIKRHLSRRLGLGAERIPDPTTAGDVCRRFAESDVLTLRDVFNRARQRAWSQQPAGFFEEAIVDADGTIVPTDADCKQRVDSTYDGQWGYPTLVVSLASTAEPLFVLNRSGDRALPLLVRGYGDHATPLGHDP